MVKSKKCLVSVAVFFLFQTCTRQSKALFCEFCFARKIPVSSYFAIAISSEHICRKEFSQDIVIFKYFPFSCECHMLSFSLLHSLQFHQLF